MKTYRIWIVVVLLLTLNLACEKDNIEIKYPQNGDFGENILQNDSLIIKSSGDASSIIKYYSLKAELPSDTYVKLIMKKKSKGNGFWFFSTGSQIGWALDNFMINPSSQRLFAYGQVVCDIKIFFTFTGSAEIEIYENQDTIPKRIKTIQW